MIFEHDDFGNSAMLCLVGIDPVLQYHAKSVSGINVFNPQSIGKKSFANRFAILRAGHSIHEQCMRMNHKLGFENIVQRGFHRWTTRFVEYSFPHEILNQFLPGMRFFGSFHIVQFIDLCPVQGHESIFLKSGESCP